MKLDRKLNFVVPVYDDQDRPVYVHSMPISKEVFEAHFRVLSRAFNEIFTGGFGMMAGPRMSALLVKDIARKDGVWEGRDGVENTLFAEIFRLTNVIAPGEKGWETIPWAEALQRGLISEEDASEVENAIVFFIVNSAMHRKKENERILESAARLWGAQISSLGCTEFQNSLPTSTPAVTTVEKAGPAPVTQSLIPH